MKKAIQYHVCLHNFEHPVSIHRDVGVALRKATSPGWGEHIYVDEVYPDGSRERVYDARPSWLSEHEMLAAN
jgi:hypothetical protein